MLACTSAGKHTWKMKDNCGSISQSPGSGSQLPYSGDFKNMFQFFFSITALKFPVMNICGSFSTNALGLLDAKAQLIQLKLKYDKLFLQTIRDFSYTKYVLAWYKDQQRRYSSEEDYWYKEAIFE